MAPRRILALLPEAVTARRCLHFAWAASEIDAAEVEAFHVKVDPEKLVTAPEEVSLQQMRIPREGTAAARAEAVRAVFDAWLAGLPIDSRTRVSWREAVGAEEAAVTRESKVADLVVVPSPHNIDGGDANHAAFRTSHRPVLFVPDGVRFDRFAGHMAIAWKDAANTARAVQGAAVWLRGARRVSTIVVADDLDRGGWPAGERFLRQLGVVAEPILAAPDGLRVGERLLHTVRELNADTLVLGAYRYSDVVEWMLPSTTRHVLHHANIPLFLAH